MNGLRYEICMNSICLIEMRKLIITIKMQWSIVTITEEALADDGIEQYEWHKYGPEKGMKLNITGEIRRSIETADMFTEFAES